MNTKRTGANPEELMMFQGIVTELKNQFWTCKGLHQNTQIRQSTILIEQSYCVFLNLLSVIVLTKWIVS